MRVKQGTVRTRHVTKADGKERVTEREEFVGKLVSGDALSNVGFGAAFTKGLPNYSSIRVEVDCHMPCRQGQELKVFKEVRTFVVKRLQRAIQDVVDDLAKDLE